MAPANLIDGRAIARQLQDELAQSSKSVDDLLHKQAENRSRLHVLEQLQSDYEGFSAGTLAALKGTSSTLKPAFSTGPFSCSRASCAPSLMPSPIAA